MACKAIPQIPWQGVRKPHTALIIAGYDDPILLSEAIDDSFNEQINAQPKYVTKIYVNFEHYPVIHDIFAIVVVFFSQNNQHSNRVVKKSQQRDYLKVITLQNIVDCPPDFIATTLVFSFSNFDQVIELLCHAILNWFFVLWFQPMTHICVEIVEVIIQLIEDQKNTSDQVRIS